MALTLGEKNKIFQGKFISVWETIYFDKAGGQRSWEWVAKNDAVYIFPITKDQKIVLIRNFRVPLERYVLEIPAGQKDKDNESSLITAQRELLEETGYQADNWVQLPVWPYRSSASNALAHGFIAYDLQKVSDAHGDITEDIAIVELPVEELLELFTKPSEHVLVNPEILGLYTLAKLKGLLP